MIKLKIDYLTTSLMSEIIDKGYCQFPCSNVDVNGKNAQIYLTPLIYFEDNSLNFYPCYKIDNECLYGDYAIDRDALNFKLDVIRDKNLKLIEINTSKEACINMLNSYKHKAKGKTYKKLYL